MCSGIFFFERETVGTMLNESRVGEITVAGQPTADEIRGLRAAGYTTVVNLRMPDEYEPPQVDEATIRACGLSYAHVPLTGPTLSAEHIRKVREAVEAADGSVLVH